MSTGIYKITNLINGKFYIEGVFISEYLTLKDAINSFNPPANNIGDCCRGKTKKANGYIWRYAETICEVT
jgi:hypothetical protein